MTATTARAIFHELVSARAPPAIPRVSRISSGAYATDESASLAKTGNAMRLGRRVSPSRSERMARPRMTRLTTRPEELTAPLYAPARPLAAT